MEYSLVRRSLYKYDHSTLFQVSKFYYEYEQPSPMFSTTLPLYSHFNTFVKINDSRRNGTYLAGNLDTYSIQLDNKNEFSLDNISIDDDRDLYKCILYRFVPICNYKGHYIELVEDFSSNYISFDIITEDMISFDGSRTFLSKIRYFGKNKLFSSSIIGGSRN